MFVSISNPDLGGLQGPGNPIKLSCMPKRAADPSSAEPDTESQAIGSPLPAKPNPSLNTVP